MLQSFLTNIRIPGIFFIFEAVRGPTCLISVPKFLIPGPSFRGQLQRFRLDPHQLREMTLDLMICWEMTVDLVFFEEMIVDLMICGEMTLDLVIFCR